MGSPRKSLTGRLGGRGNIGGSQGRAAGLGGGMCPLVFAASATKMIPGLNPRLFSEARKGSSVADNDLIHLSIVQGLMSHSRVFRRPKIPSRHVARGRLRTSRALVPCGDLFQYKDKSGFPFLSCSPLPWPPVRDTLYSRVLINLAAQAQHNLQESRKPLIS